MAQIHGEGATYRHVTASRRVTRTGRATPTNFVVWFLSTKRLSSLQPDLMVMNLSMCSAGISIKRETQPHTIAGVGPLS
jgi:hypothetical protein